MRRIIVVSMISCMVALMAAQPVSAGDLSTYVTDAVGDTPYFWDMETGEALTLILNGNQKWCSYGYLDMTSYMLSKNLETNTFTFRMEVAGDFPEPGDEMWNGVQRVEWVVWFEREPFNPVLSPEATTEYVLNLTFDGTGYTCRLLDYVPYGGDVIEILVPSFDGNVYSVSFSGDPIVDIIDDNDYEFYWIVCSRVIRGGYSCLWADWTDWNAAEGQIWSSIPWPSLVEP